VGHAIVGARGYGLCDLGMRGSGSRELPLAASVGPLLGRAASLLGRAASLLGSAVAGRGLAEAAWVLSLVRMGTDPDGEDAPGPSGLMHWEADLASAWIGRESGVLEAMFGIEEGTLDPEVGSGLSPGAVRRRVDELAGEISRARGETAAWCLLEMRSGDLGGVLESRAMRAFELSGVDPDLEAETRLAGISERIMRDRAEAARAMGAIGPEAGAPRRGPDRRA
jgi:hypothetical protein